MDVVGCPADETAKLDEVMDPLGPGDEIVTDSFTSPAKPLRPLTMIVDVLLVPAGIVSDAGLDVIMKSSGLMPTKTSKVDELEIVPLDPSTTTV